MMRRPACFVLLSLLTASLWGGQNIPPPGRTARGEDVLREIARLEREYGGHLGVMAKDLATGEEVAFNASERFPTASVIKLPVMAAFFHLVQQRKVDPAARIVLTEEDKKPGSGVLQYLSAGASLSLLDAVRLMIIQSDNTATNLVLDRIADSHEARLAAVNEYMAHLGLKNTRLLNRLFSGRTKQRSPEGIRYGIGVSTPEDMVLLLEMIHKGSAVDSASSSAMIEILKQQAYNDMMPRFLPSDARIEVAHKTGSVDEVRVDVGLMLSQRTNIAVAIFVDKHPDHRWTADNQASELGARVARTLWNHFAGSSGKQPGVAQGEVDWTTMPGGSWCIYRTAAAPFPHPARMQGYRRPDSTYYPFSLTYCDSSVIVFVPEGLRQNGGGTNVIVHYHGHLNDNLGVLERYLMPQSMIAESINALLIIPQGPYRARDSFGGKMEDRGGCGRLVDDVMAKMTAEKIIPTPALGKVIISAHSGGYRPAAFSADSGGLGDHLSHLFLFDAFYGQHDLYRHWLENSGGTIFAAYTDHLASKHLEFTAELPEKLRLHFEAEKTTVEHDSVVQTFLRPWLARLDSSWKK